MCTIGVVTTATPLRNSSSVGGAGTLMRSALSNWVSPRRIRFGGPVVPDVSISITTPDAVSAAVLSRRDEETVVRDSAASSRMSASPAAATTPGRDRASEEPTSAGMPLAPMSAESRCGGCSGDIVTMHRWSARRATSTATCSGLFSRTTPTRAPRPRPRVVRASSRAMAMVRKSPQVVQSPSNSTAWASSGARSRSVLNRSRVSTSPSLPDRGPLLGEGSCSLACILGREHRRHQVVLTLQALCHRPVPGGSSDLLGDRDGERAVGCDGCRKGQCPVERATLGGDAVDETKARSSCRVDGVSGQQQLQRDGQRHPARQEQRCPRTGDQRTLDLGDSELRSIGGNDEVAAEHDLEPSGEGPALDGSDERLAGRAQREAGETAAFDHWALSSQEALEVHACAESATRAGEYGD